MSLRANLGHTKRRSRDMLSHSGDVLQAKDTDWSPSAVYPEDSETAPLHIKDPHGRDFEGGAAAAGHSLLPEIERRVHWNLLPWFFVLVVFCFVDRANLTFASIQMKQELKINDEEYGLGAGLFFVGYALFQVPSNAFLMRLGPSTWLAVLTLLWGLCATAFAFCNGVHLFLLLRFFLGLFEAGAMPGMWYSLSLFYPSDRTNFPYAVIETGITVSQVLGSPLAAALLQMDGLTGLSGWQWIFLVEGLPTMLLGAVIKFALPDTVAHARFLSSVQQEVLGGAIAAQRSTAGEPLTWSLPDQWRLLKSVARNWRVWYAGCWRIFHDVAGYGVLYWTPMLVESMLAPQQAAAGEAPQQQQDTTGAKLVLLSAIPFAAASLFHVANAHHSQKVGERRLHISLPWLVASLSLLLLPSAATWGFLPSFSLLVLAHVGVNGANGIQTSWVASCLDGPAKALGLPMYNMIGGLGGFFGPWVIGIVKQKSRSYDVAMLLLGLFLLVGTAMVWMFPDSNGDVGQGKAGGARAQQVWRQEEEEAERQQERQPMLHVESISVHDGGSNGGSNGGSSRVGNGHGHM